MYDPSTEFQTPVLYSWNLSVERQLPSQFLVRVGYVGSHGSHIKESLDLNPAVPSTTSFSDARRRLNIPFRTALYSDIFMDKQDINSSYNSLQAALERRITGGLTIILAYKW